MSISSLCAVAISATPGTRYGVPDSDPWCLVQRGQEMYFDWLDYETIIPQTNSASYGVQAVRDGEGASMSFV